MLGPKPLVNNPNIIAATLSANSSSMRTALGVMSYAEVTSAIELGSGVTSVGVSSTDFTVSGSPVTTLALHLYQLDWCPNSILQGIKDLRAVAAGRGFATKPMLVTEGSPSLEYLTDDRTRQFKVRAM